MHGIGLLTRTSFLGVLVVALGFLVGAVSQPEAATAQTCPYEHCHGVVGNYSCAATTTAWECDINSDGTLCSTKNCDTGGGGDDPCCIDPESTEQ